MPLPDHDTGMQVIVAELAALHADDIAAILSALSTYERRAVEEELRGYIARFENSLASPSKSATYDLFQLSPWLSQQLQATSRDDCGMTVLARQTLVDCVTRLYPARGG